MNPAAPMRWPQDMATRVGTYGLSGILILIAGLGIAVMGWRKGKKINHLLTGQQEALQKSRDKYKMIVERAGEGHPHRPESYHQICQFVGL